MRFGIFGGAFGAFLAHIGIPFTHWQFYVLFAFLIAAFVFGANER